MYIQVKNLTKIFKNNFAVNKINFDIEKNKTVGLLGPNGCGKTNSIGMMLGLIDQSEGEILMVNKNYQSFFDNKNVKYKNFVFEGNKNKINSLADFFKKHKIISKNF